MSITKEDMGKLSAMITVELAKEDYLPKVDAELKKIRKDAQIKGFRPGKVPMGVIRKRFGNNVLGEAINEVLNERLKTYFEEAKLDYLAQPLPIPNPEMVIDINNLRDYSFKYELGLAPEFDVKGLDETFVYHDVQIKDETINSQIEQMQKQLGGMVENPEGIEEGDVLLLELAELDENGEVKEDGIRKEGARISLDKVADESLKSKFLAASRGDNLTIDNVFALEDAKEEHVRRYILGLEESDEREISSSFNAIIEEVSRVNTAPIDEAFFNHYFQDNEEVRDEDALREAVKNEIKGGYEKNARILTSNYIYRVLREANQEFDMPDDFLKRYLVESNEELTEEQVAEFYGNFVSDTRWQLVYNKLAKEYEVKLEYSDVLDYVRNEMASQYGVPAMYIPDDMVNKTIQERGVDNYMNAVAEQKTLQVLVDKVTLDVKEVTEDEFTEVIKAENERLQEEREARAKEAQEAEVENTEAAE